MGKWKDDGDYMTKKYDNKKKKRVIGYVSIKKSALNVLNVDQVSLVKQITKAVPK